MAEDPLVIVEGVSKRFCRSLKRSLWYGVCDVASEFAPWRAVEGILDLRPDEFWAVNDVSFELRRGECLGLIGHNGSGKTTLLKMLSGLIKPDKGRIEMRGRVGALIALGAGFNPILTGRENIYVNGSVLGLTRREIEAKIEAIIDFADIREFIDSPVQSYSSGMQVRLGFAVASSLDPDIMIADEVLAVGDATFRAKCYRRLADLRAAGTTILLVSHHMPDIQRVCTRCIWLSGGRMAAAGDTASVASEYLVWSDQQAKGQERMQPEAAVTKLSGARIVRVDTLDAAGRPALEFKTGEELRIRLEYEVEPGIFGVTFSLSFNSGFEDLYNGYATKHDGFKVQPLSPRGHIDLVFAHLGLGAGAYWISAAIADEGYLGFYDWNWQAKRLVVKSAKPMLGRFSLPHFWEYSERGNGSGGLDSVAARIE